MDSRRKPGDRRKEFAELSRQHPVDESAVRAFIEARIEMIRADPRMDPEAKERAVSELRQQLVPHQEK